MRRVLTQVGTMLVVIVTMGAAHGPNTSEVSKAVVGPPPSNPANSSEQQSRAQTHKKPKPYEIGRASWYGQYFHGRQTASGEPYNMYLLTAAHPQLPLGTYVKVTSLRTGNIVIVRVNDRGPVVPGRIIDLSYGAARMLGFQARGIERVRLDVLPETAVAKAGMH